MREKKKLEVVGAKRTLSNPHMIVSIVLDACDGTTLNISRMPITIWGLFFISRTLLFVEPVRCDTNGRITKKVVFYSLRKKQFTMLHGYPNSTYWTHNLQIKEGLDKIK